MTTTYGTQQIIRTKYAKDFKEMVLREALSGRGTDETAYVVLKYLNGYLFLMDVGGYSEGYSDLTLTQLATRARFWDVDLVIVEANFGDGMFTKVMTPIFNKIHPCGIEEVKSTGQKEARIIDTLEPVMMRHKLIVNRPIIEADYKVFTEKKYEYSLVYQMTRLCREKNALPHDDRLDALAMGVGHFVEMMDVADEDKIMELTEEQLEHWMEVSVLEEYANIDYRHATVKAVRDTR